MSTIFWLWVLVAIVLIYVFWQLTQRGDMSQRMKLIRSKIEALSALGQYQEHLIAARLSAEPNNTAVMSFADIDTSMRDVLGAIILRVDTKNPNEREISIIDSSLNRIWQLRRAIDIKLSQ